MAYNSIRWLLSKAYRLSLGLFIYLFDSACLPFLPAVTSSRKTVLVVRLDNIGDYLVWAGQLTGLRSKYPRREYSLTLLGNRVWTELADQNAIFDKVIPLDTRRFIRSPIYRFCIFSELRRAGFGVVIQPTYSRDFYRGDSIVRLCGAPVRIGFSGDCCNSLPLLKIIADHWYTKLVVANVAQLPEIQRNVEFMRGLGIDNVPLLVNLSVDRANSAGGFGSGDYFVLFPGASQNIRRWPAEHFAEIARRVRNFYGINGVICGTAAELPLALSINKYSDVPLVELCGKTTLTDLVSVIGNARILITNETSAAHIGPATGTPTVCILGGGHFGRFLPYRDLPSEPAMRVIYQPMDCYGCNWRCKFSLGLTGSAPCISDIEVKDVWAGVVELLNVKGSEGVS